MATVKARLLEGDRPGTVIEADLEVAQCWVASGKAELVAPERTAEVEEPETPERVTRRRRKAAPDIETRST